MALDRGLEEAAHRFLNRWRVTKHSDGHRCSGREIMLERAQEKQLLVTEQLIETGLGDADRSGNPGHIAAIKAMRPEMANRRVERLLRRKTAWPADAAGDDSGG